jgi:hypothetical protein
MLHKALEGAVMLHTFPKTTVDVFALVLESGGSTILSYTFLLIITGLLLYFYWVMLKLFPWLICR